MSEPIPNGTVRVAVVASSSSRAEALATRVRAPDVRVTITGTGDEPTWPADVEVIVAGGRATLRRASLVKAGGRRIPVVLLADSEDADRDAVPRERVEAELSGDAPPSQVRAAVLAVAAGLVVSPAGESRRDPRVVTDADEGAPVEGLTPRELEVLDALALGLSNRAIASRLGLSEHTVKFHVASIFGKLDARTRTQAVRHALARGLLAI